MKKAISVLMCIALVACSVFAMAGCAKKNQTNSDIVLITDGGTISDSSYNQSAWEGITAFADKENMSCRYYQPVLDDKGELTVENVEKYVDLAAKNEAKYVVLPGESFAVSAYEIAPSYPDISFILVDAMPHSADNDTDHYISNVMCVSFDTMQSGFLAGYIAVATGNTKLGFLGENSSDDSANYGAGFAQGAAYAAQQLGIPVTLDWADYDSPLLDYVYDFNVTACYEKISDVKEDTFTVKVENGSGDGTYTEGTNVSITADPAPVGKEFDEWEVKSATDGVKDSKVNVSSKKKSVMNLIAEKCDCVITAKYKDIEGDYSNVTILNSDGTGNYLEQSVKQNSQLEVTAPPATVADTVFDHWESSIDGALEDAQSATTNVNVTDKDIVLTPVYVQSDKPVCTVNVVTGEGGDGESTGSGVYTSGETVTVSAAVPKEGYMFSHWENSDAYGNSTGIALENEYCYNTSFEMVDRYASICQTMADDGVTAFFAGGNSQSESLYTAKWKFDSSPNVIEAGTNHDDAYCAVIKNYGEAVKDCLSDFKGGSVVTADCKSGGISATYVSDDKDVQAAYDEMFTALSDGRIEAVRAQKGAGYDFCSQFVAKEMSDCLTLNGWYLVEKQ